MAKKKDREAGELHLEFRVPVTLRASCLMENGSTFLKDDVAISINRGGDGARMSISLKELLTALYELESKYGEQEDLEAAISGYRAVADHTKTLAAKLEALLAQP
jgi:hypothetical protein